MGGKILDSAGSFVWEWCCFYRHFSLSEVRLRDSERWRLYERPATGTKLLLTVHAVGRVLSVFSFTVILLIWTPSVQRGYVEWTRTFRLQVTASVLGNEAEVFALNLPSILSHRTCTKNWVLETRRVAGLCETDAATLALLDFDVLNARLRSWRVGSCQIGLLHTFKRNFSLKKADVLISIGLHVLRDFMLDVIRQHVLRNASLLYTHKTTGGIQDFAPQPQPRPIGRSVTCGPVRH